MAHPFHHSQQSVRRYGGTVDDYIAIHEWFDESKAFIPLVVHRGLRHHAQGIFDCEARFGRTVVNSDGREIPVRFVGEQHVREDCGRIPCLSDWFREIPMRSWMAAGRLQDTNPAAGGDLSMAAWRHDVATQRTLLGYPEWVTKQQAGSDPTR